MKGYFVIILLLVSSAIATYLFQEQHKDKPDLMDTLAIGLDPIAKLLPENSFIYYDTQQVNQDVFTRARYLLAPRNLVMDKNATLDTLLTIIDTITYNSNSYTTLPNIVIEYKTGSYYYILSTNK
ncbi:MAG: hypothetical protein R2800_02770 [Flavipsychrobacter sp.]